MAGKTKPRCACSVPGHGMSCAVAAEKTDRQKGRAREKAEVRREVESR